MQKSIRFKYTKQFLRDVGKLNIHQTEQLKERLEIFQKNQNSPLLRNHELKGGMKKRFSINITGDIRAIYRILNKDKSYLLIEFIRLGTHSQLY